MRKKYQNKSLHWLIVIQLTFSLFLKGQDSIVFLSQSFWELNWEAELDTEYGCISSGAPLLYNDLIFTSCHTDFAIDASSGNKIFFSSQEQLIDIQSRLNGYNWLLFNRPNEVIIMDLSNGEEKINFTRERRRKWPYKNSPLLSKAMFYYAKDDFTLIAYNAEVGNTVWSYKSANIIYDEVRVIEDRLFLGTENELVILDVNNGKELKKVETGKHISKLRQIDNSLIFLVEDKGLFSIDCNSLLINWIYSDILYYRSGTELLTDGESVYFTGEYLHSVDLESGEKNWTNVTTSTAGFNRNIFLVEDYILTYFQEGEDGVDLNVYNKFTGKRSEEWAIVGDEEGIPKYYFCEELFNRENVIAFSRERDKVYSFKLLAPR